MKLFRSKGYRVLSGYIYGWGATCVIIGALFKIMHFPYAGIILTVGMIVEAFIFFISAFEPQMEHYDWARVFPQLGGNGVKSQDAMRAGMQTVAGGIPSMGLEQKDADDLKKGIRKITETADSFAEIAVQAPAVAQKISQVSNSFERLDTHTRMMGDALENSAKELTRGCSDMNRMVADSTRELSEKIKMNCEKMMQGIAQAGDQYVMLGSVIGENTRQIKSSMQGFVEGNVQISEHIAALNTLYEIQVKDTKESLENFKKVNNETNKVLEHVVDSSGNTSRFKEESRQLAEKVSSLNSIYGNMLSLINNN